LHVDVNRLAERYQALPIKDKKALAINGGELVKELQLAPGPLFGKILANLEYQVVMGQVSNDKEMLLRAAVEFVQKEKK
jgi:tRNA nucleotidyltransferase (CCA-adding enzyme)